MSGDLIHITLNTGHRIRQSRTRDQDKSIAFTGELLDAAIMGGHPALPFDDGLWLVSAVSHGRDLIASLWRGPWDSRIPILTMAVAVKSKSAPQLWELMHRRDDLQLATMLSDRPPAPWVADRLEASAIDYLDALTWTAGLSRSLAWAWMEYDK